MELFDSYSPLAGTFDECFQTDGAPRPEAQRVIELLNGLGEREFRARRKLADATFLREGITFSVYSDQQGSERIFPFDLIPRVIPASDWSPLRRGLLQRIQALNEFLTDIYGEQRILKEGRVPADLVLGAKGYLPAMRGVTPPHGVYIHIAGIDLIRGPDGEILVLEDNVRDAVGGVVRDREPHGHEKGVSAGICASARDAGG